MKKERDLKKEYQKLIENTDLTYATFTYMN